MPVTKIRQSVFETNSSSTHSLVIGDAKQKLGFSKETLRSKKLTVTPEYFGWEWARYYTPESKILYMFAALWETRKRNDFVLWLREISNICTKNGIEVKFPPLKNSSNPEFATIDDIEKIGASAFDIEDGECGIDHDSVGTFPGDLSVEKIEDFIFDRRSFFETGNDNSFAYEGADANSLDDAMILTDLGPEKYGENGPRSEWVGSTIESWKRYRDSCPS
jgi:hypothetical protein